ncbi:hypothetical protein ACFYNF_34155 [Streptomyces sp. NPDC006641]|uniref:hypothetical protein n=1 Tax=unclassified Streptomyces TaxID=2593676 RepID=UPI0036C75F36
MATAVEAPASNTAEGPTSHTQNQNDNRPTDTNGYTRAEQIEALHKLREPFIESEIRYRPQPWCKACSDSRTKNCQNHEKRQCRTCGQKLTTAHIDLKYVGHAEATNRLLNVDPFWDWEPLALDAQGLPQYDANRALWIRMTVCGMTRLGYGDATGKSGANAVKEIIGDAIRNAGMRFGMALDLWTSSDLEIIESGGASIEGGESATPATKPALQQPTEPETPKSVNHLDRLMSQVRDCWMNAVALEQIKADATKHKVINEQVQDPFGNWMPFHQLLDNRIAELKQGGAERSAA